MKTSGNVQDSTLSLSIAHPSPLSPSLPDIFLVWIGLIWSLAVCASDWVLWLSLRNKVIAQIFGWPHFLMIEEWVVWRSKGAPWAPSRRPSRYIHLSCCGLTVCPDFLQPVFMSQFFSQLNGCLLYAPLTTDHGYESPAGIRALTCSHTLLLANLAPLLDFYPQMVSFLPCFWEKVVKTA